MCFKVLSILSVFVWKIITTETKIPGIIYHAVWFMCIINYAIWCMVNNKIQISLFILCCYYFRHLTTYVTSWLIYLLAWIWLVAVNEQIHRHLNVWILEYIHMDNILTFLFIDIWNGCSADTQNPGISVPRN